MHGAWQTWTKTFTIAKKLGVDRRQLTANKCAGETSEMRSGRLAANELAKMILKEADALKRKINDNDVLAVLRMWGFKENTTRTNVMKEGVKTVHSDTLGLVASYDGAVLITDPTQEYPDFTRVLCRRLSDHMPKEFSKQPFGWSSINVNANYAGALHRDANNEGPSFIKAFGNFTGGRLNYWGDDCKAEGAVESLCKPGDSTTLDISKSLLLFDGNRGHSVEKFSGERYSLVWFCTGQHEKANKKVSDALQRCGIRLPSKTSTALTKKMLGKPRGYKALAKSKSLSATEKPMARIWPQQDAKRQGTDFLSKASQEKAKDAMRKLNFGPSSDSGGKCTDTKFVSFRTAYATLADKRRQCMVYLKGVSGAETMAVLGVEDGVGSGHYLYTKTSGFTLGPPLKTERMCEVRTWCSKLGVKTARKELVVRSYANKKGGEKRSMLVRKAPPAKKARMGGA